MINEQHLITPPTELVELWRSQWVGADTTLASYIAAQAARWGADQELEACCTEVTFWGSKGMADRLQATRRPKPLSKADRALAALREVESSGNLYVNGRKDTIRLALEHLKELEQLND